MLNDVLSLMPRYLNEMQEVGSLFGWIGMGTVGFLYLLD